MPENLLTRLTMSVMSRQGENVASAGLLYLLQSHDQAREAFLDLLRTASGTPLPPDVRFQGQVGSRDAGVTDISGRHGNQEYVIVEAKVGAGLGHGQASAYLNRLSPEGLLVILAPESRLSALFDVACQSCGATRDGAELRARAGGRSLAAVSWTAAIKAITDKPLTAALHAEVDQVRGLYEHLDATEFVPLTSDSVSRNAARQMAALDRVVVEVQVRIDAGKVAGAFYPKKGARLAASWDAAGFGFTLAGNAVWFGRSTGRWLKHAEAETPYWLHLYKLDNQYNDAHALKRHLDGDAAGRRRCYGEPPTAIALWPALGVDIGAIVDGLAKQIEDVGHALGEIGLAAPLVAEPVPTPNDTAAAQQPELARDAFEADLGLPLEPAFGDDA